ncbi:MAG: TIGR02680 family protein, partial [Catenulispora sp.]|nr:TIGR02680 family protein [Catenulispora sp.]
AWPAGAADPDGLSERAAARSAARSEAVRAIRAALDAVRRAEQARDHNRVTLDRALDAQQAAQTAERAAAQVVAAARSEAEASLAAWWREHGSQLPQEIAEPLADALADALAGVGEPEAPTMSVVYSAAVQPRADALRGRQAELRAERGRLETERAETVAERDRIAAEHDDAPPARAGRAADTSAMPGAPLWRLVRFADAVGDAEAAGLEAALEAAGLLDAWITPEAAPVTSGDSLAYLRPGPAAAGPSLADVLVPDVASGEDSPVSAARLTAILRSVATGGDLAAHPAVITRDGRYAQGVQAGAHRKEHAEFIGATARRRRREARIAECEDRLSALDGMLDDLDAQAAQLSDALLVLDAAASALPRTGAITAALQELGRADAVLRATREAADQAQASYDEAVAAVGVTERALHRTAAEHRIAPDAADAVEAAVQRFGTAAKELTAARREEGRQRENVGAAEERLTVAEDEAQAAAAEEASAQLKYAEEQAKLDALHSTLGADAAAVLAQVQEAETALSGAEAEVVTARDAERDAASQAGAATATLNAAREAAFVAAAEERATARDLAPYAQRELLDLLKCPPGLSWPAQEADWAGERLPEAVTAVHAAIGAATRDLAPSENTLKASTTRLTKALDDLQAQLGAAGQDYRPEWDGADGVIVVRIADEQGPLPVGAFAQRIAAARRDQQLLLSDSEQRILEDALLTRLAQQIHDRTVDSRDLIRRMNTEMRSRRMSSGATVGVAWLLADDLDAEQRAVCSLLDADAARLTPDALARMRTHFASQIKNARARWRDRPYRELLADVLDYRTWRQFAFHLVRPDGSEERLTRARHSRLSGGEQSVSLHLPLFAAAHAMLNSAAPHAPRLLALDEAFAGVDDTGRGELLALAAQFDLDLFMTGYDLWAAHASVPAAAHYDLAHSPQQHAVSALLLVWDGSELLADDAGELAAALGSPGTRRVPVAA